MGNRRTAPGVADVRRCSWNACRHASLPLVPTYERLAGTAPPYRHEQVWARHRHLYRVERSRANLCKDPVADGCCLRPSSPVGASLLPPRSHSGAELSGIAHSLPQCLSLPKPRRNSTPASCACGCLRPLTETPSGCRRPDAAGRTGRPAQQPVSTRATQTHTRKTRRQATCSRCYMLVPGWEFKPERLTAHGSLRRATAGSLVPLARQFK